MTTIDSPPAIVVTYEHKVATIAAVLMAETGGGWSSMCAVAQVISNRGGDPYTVVTQPKQFSCLNRTNPHILIQKFHADDASLTFDARLLANRLLRIPLLRFSKEIGPATHYHSTKITPSWAKGKKPIAVICGHKFYKLP